MRAVKCPVSDATASTAPRQGQLEEELLIYGQCCCNSSATCRQDSAFHLQTTGSYFPYPITGLSPPSPPPTWCFCKFFSCLFVCLFFSVSMLAAWFASSHRDTQIQLSAVCIFSVCHTQTQTNTLVHLHKSLFSPTPLPPTLISSSDDAGRLTRGLLVNMINPSSVKFSAQA